MLSATRERRPNAGARMARLLDGQDAADDFYKTTYGGFHEVAEDASYESPDCDSDSVDSDFDVSETDGEASGGDSDAEAKAKRQRRVVTKAYKEPLARAAIAAKTDTRKAPKRQSGNQSFFGGAPEAKRLRQSTLEKSAEAVEKVSHSVKPKGHRRQHAAQRQLTQKELLAEAKITERQNLKSLENYRQFELEKKNLRRNAVKRPVIDGPKIRFLSVTMPVTDAQSADLADADGQRRCARTFVEFPDEQTMARWLPSTSGGGRQARREGRTCAVTGRRARYVDPLTRLPYVDAAAFASLRAAYARFVEQKADRSDPAVAAWLSWRADHS